MWTPERERRQFELVWKCLWPAFGAVFGLTLGGLVGGAMAGPAGALLTGAVGVFIGAELGHVLGLLLLLIFRPWIEFFESGKLGPLLAGSFATTFIATCTLRTFDDAGLAVFVSCLGFAFGDTLAFVLEATASGLRRKSPNPEIQDADFGDRAINGGWQGLPVYAVACPSRASRKPVN